MTAVELLGWDRLRHGGLLLDAPRTSRIAEHVPEPLAPHYERELRRLAPSVIDGSADKSAFVSFVLEKLCGFTEKIGDVANTADHGSTWQRGSSVGSEWGRRAVTGETVKPRHLWRGTNGALLPVFFDDEARLGIGRGRKSASQVVQWLRSGRERLAVLTNGRQWRLIFAGLDFDAWCEWDVDLWFDEGALASQVHALRTLLSPQLWTPPSDGAPSPLLAAILDTRKGQSELSAVLGERVREAVELLLHGHGEVLKQRCADVDPAEIYRAAVRIVMRMVVVLFAESRELLPGDNALYHGSYGLSGLLEELARIGARGGHRLARSCNAWPRVLALFRLVYDGSHHPTLLVPAYGGELFAPGVADAKDGLSRVIAVFESACFDHDLLLPDGDVLAILTLLTRTKIKVRQGRSSTWVPAPVNFSDLSSEYIGILYEGLLDFELKTAPAGDPVIFLAVGNQPALPLSRLEAMDDRALANLLEKMKETSRGDDPDADEEDADAASEEASDDTPDEAESEPGPADEGAVETTEPAETNRADPRHTTRMRAEIWARRAVEFGKLVKRPRGTPSPEKQLAFEAALASKARQLVSREILPGEWYLVRWGGTRKGAGTFYTRPGLAVPTVQRTLRPLAFTQTADGASIPKTPDEILALKVCDPACGSGTFPVAALRFLTDALFKSLLHHHLLSSNPSDAASAIELPGHEPLPCRPDDPHFEPRVKALLRRLVVERCLYGVDLDPLAVELCRLALWIETMDRSLPFSFLDHKIKCGNSLVGAWFDQFQHYPVMAWKGREGGDKNHGNGVHFTKDARGKALKEFTKRVAPDLADVLKRQGGLFARSGPSPESVLATSRATLARLHELPVRESAERSRLYRAEFLGGEGYRALKEAMDLWCACWFWPAADDELASAPLPSTFAAPEPPTRAIAARVATKQRFFHWELEFPDVFRANGAGFDAILGNPPWEIAKPISKEFFSDRDPLYRSYGKQEALAHQTQLFADAEVERSWVDYNADLRAQSNFMGQVASPFGDPNGPITDGDRFSIARGKQNDGLHERWRVERVKTAGFADPAHSFRHQGSADLNLYKLFLEQAHALLRGDGRLGVIVPSGLYSDHGTGGMRSLFLDRCRWEWLFGFENRDAIFEIHRSFKFNPIILQKGGRTEAIRTAFMRRRLEDWERAEELATPYTRAQVDRFSPRSKAILEIQSPRDLEILEKIYSNSVLLGDDGPDGWGIKYSTEFHMTNDSKLFPPRPKWEEQGYRPDEYSRWLRGDWRPIAELWKELGVDANKVAPIDPACEQDIARRGADVQRTSSKLRCAQPPYDTLPTSRADIPAGIVFSRDADAWIREERIDQVPVRVKAEDGQEPTAIGRAVALPLYQGIMVQAFMPSARGWLSGTGLTARWDYNSASRLMWNPQYLVGLHDASERVPSMDLCKIGYREVARSTDTRSFIGSVLPQFPCGHKVPTLQAGGGLPSESLAAAGLLNSFVFDWLARERLGAAALAWYVLKEACLPSKEKSTLLAEQTLRVNLMSPVFAPVLLRAREAGLATDSLGRHAAISEHERLRTHVVVDVLAAAAFGLSTDDLSVILTNCALPTSTFTRRSSSSVPLDARGFWRVDKDKDPELRHTVLTLVAFHDLEQKIATCGGDRDQGIAAFLAQNDGEGWLLPETLRLADYHLGHDDRALHPQPVRSRLGPRFYDWQLAQTPEESWRECNLHARNLLGEDEFRKLYAKAHGNQVPQALKPPEISPPSRRPTDSTSRDTQKPLFS